MMVVILQLIRFGLIGLSVYMLYVEVQEFRPYPDWQEWLMLSAIVLNIVYLVAIPRLSRLIKRWFDARTSTDRDDGPAYRDVHWPVLEAPNTAPSQASDVVTSQDHSGHRLALRLTLREVAP
jgi:hypothetical protein